ncbi:MAG: aminodeoxychorismate synthase component I [Candidatus Hydrogenedens sp.]
MIPQVIIIYQQKEWHFEKPLEVIVASRIEEIVPSLRNVQQRVEQGKYAVGWVTYESGPAFDSAFPQQKLSIPDLPFVWFGIFDEPTQHLLSPCRNKVEKPPIEWQPQVSKEEYKKVIEDIHKNISYGNVYQVNYTFSFHSNWNNNLISLFYHLCFAQGEGYFVYIQTDNYTILSISPELFFHYKNGKITLKPMKGTRPRGRWNIEDKNNFYELQNDPKDRAENLMIVDLLRNDVGKIANLGSVEVPELFTCEPYRTVWQMTSTIKAKTDKSWVDVIQALFPSGSVTGAPKIYAMKLIQQYEPFPRGIYCGTVGWITPQNEAVFNVAIRTLLYHHKSQTARYYVGSGIVWDSDPDKEWEECITKGAILNKFPSYFELIETMRVENGEIFLLDYHLRRLQESADRFLFPVSIPQLKEKLLNYVNTVTDTLYRMKLSISPDSKFFIEHNSSIGPVKLRVGLAKNPINSQNLFLYHKTSYRTIYEQARQERLDCDDVLLWNEKRYVTESTIANIIVQFGDRMFTPPIHCGLLPGTFRQYLLDTHQIEERKISIEELYKADAMYLVNSVRKWIEIVLVETKL